MFFKNKKHSQGASAFGEKKKSIWKKVGIVVIVLAIAGGALAYFRLESVAGKISFGNTSLLGNLVKSLPGTQNLLKGERDGRINVLLLGMRGEGVTGGGTLADTIMVLSIHPSSGKDGDTTKASLVSIPRDLYVTVPGRSEQRKINAVYALGRERSETGGMEDMQKIISEVTGQPIHYVITINFQGFTDLVNALGGIDVTLTEPFSEGVQFHEPQVCDPYVYTVPTKPLQYQNKYHMSSTGVRRIVKSYPLCYNKSEECGGLFKLPVGTNHLDGGTALCYARARYQTSDFRRAERQQIVINEIRKKALSIGVLTDFSKVNGMIESLGNNVRTDMELWELERLYNMYKKAGDAAPLTQKVLEDSEAGLLYAPEVNAERGYILLPRGENYDRIQEFFRSIP
jgi:LCP family protein required for cell wall assembly